MVCIVNACSYCDLLNLNYIPVTISAGDKSEYVLMTDSPNNRAEAQLNALSDAVKAMTEDLSLEHVLKQMAEVAANLVGTRYAALGVPDGKGGLAQFYTYGMSEKQISHM